MEGFELNALKPCPFCGGRKIELDKPDLLFYGWFCQCSNCKATIAYNGTRESAIENWNRRAPEWVSTKQAVPSDMRLCVIATNYGMGVAQHISADGDGWLTAHDWVEDEVTHWHEMPKDWIPVSEKLPEMEGQYLVVRDDKIYCIADYDGDGEWMTWNLCNITRLVTHWQPLPDAPKEDEEDE